MKKIIRRDFIKTAALTTAAASAGVFPSCNNPKNESPSVISSKSYEWKMVTTWPPHFPILGEYADKLAEWIKKMSSGRMQIQVYGGGELVPSLEVFDAVSQGVAEMGHGAAYYWAGKIPAAQIFTSVPFGMNAQQTNAWLYDGGGLDLWKDLYSRFNLIPFPCGNTGGQMGGWYNKEINSFSDFKGLKVRMPGLGGKVISAAGASTILSPGGELYTNLERGVIDALEWVGPYHDHLMGFHNIAKYYYYPGWQEPSAVLELIINKSAFNNLPEDLQEIIKIASHSVNVMMLSEFEAKNSKYYSLMKDEEKVQFRKFPDEVFDRLMKTTTEVLDQLAASDAASKLVYESYKNFKMRIAPWTNIIESNYM